MAELDSEDSLSGVLVIDEPNYDYNQIKTLNNSDSDVEIIDIKDNVNTISSSSDNGLLDCVKKLKGSLGNAINGSKVQQLATKRKKSAEVMPEVCIKSKRGRSSKIRKVPKQPVPQLIPLNFRLLPKTGPPTEQKLYNPSLNQILLNDIEPEYPCTICGQIFRHNIGLICHLNTEHNKASSGTDSKEKRKTHCAKTRERKKSTEKNVNENKQIENDELMLETINLTLFPDLKKDTLLSRMKSYVYSPNKTDVICVLCKAEFPNTKKALAHIEDKHITKKIECAYCNMKFVYELKLRSHMAKRHKVIGVYKCDKCSKMINREEYESHSEKCTGQMSTAKIATKEGTKHVNN